MTERFPYVEEYEGEPGLEYPRPDRIPRDLSDSAIGDIAAGIVAAYSPQDVQRLSRKEYREVYLKSERWAAVRNRVLQDRGPHCEDCGATDGWRHVDIHHLTYERLGNEDDADLLVVCRTCHNKRHGRLL